MNSYLPKNKHFIKKAVLGMVLVAIPSTAQTLLIV